MELIEENNFEARIEGDKLIFKWTIDGMVFTIDIFEGSITSEATIGIS